jgi:uncharacterized membrane-anchored protein YitT (DUF2179 family)
MASHAFSIPSWHRLQDDVQGLVTGTLFVALGIFLMQCAGLVPGGIVGIALLLHYGTGLGAGMLIVFRHGGSLGGLNVLVLRLQDRHVGRRAGRRWRSMRWWCWEAGGTWGTCAGWSGRSWRWWR